MDAEKMEERNVNVAIRCRPISSREKKIGKPQVIQCKPQRHEVTLKKKTYTFDHVFGPYSTQKDVFKTLIQPVVDEALDGYNCTIFAYGQTGTGKTHTIQGELDPDHEFAGIIPRAVQYIYDFLQSNYQDYSVRISFLQLYNEELSDLLGNDNGMGKKLRLMEDVKKGGVYCQNLQEIPTATAKDVFALLEKGVKNRTTAETALNENSSRSHSIFTLRLHTKETVPGGEDLLKTGTLNLVDLAGSECIGRSGARHARAREAGNINQSLLTLGRVITALVDKHPHVPYRDSKLTRLLQESLGGRAKTTIIATLAPCGDSLDETASTLDYASRAKNIKNKPEVNQRTTKHALLKDYSQEIDSLREALQSARDKDGVFLAPEKFAEMQQRMSGQRTQIDELEEAIEKRNEELSEAQTTLTEREAALQQSKEELDQTSRELASTTEALATTNEELKQTTEEMEWAKENLRAFKTNEIFLISNGETGTTLFKRATCENTRLQESLESRRVLEGSNVELKNEFLTSAANALQSLTSELTSQASELTSSIDTASVEIKEVADAHNGEIEAVRGAVKEFESTVKGFMAEFVSKSTEGVSEMTVQAQKHESLDEETKSELENQVNSMQQKTADSIKDLNDMISRLDRTMQTSMETALISLNSLVVNSNAASESVRSSLATFKGELFASYSAQESNMTRQNDALTSFASKNKESVKSQVEALRDSMMASLEQIVSSHMSIVDGAMNEIRDISDGSMADIKKNVKSAEAFFVAQEKSISSSEAKMDALCEKIHYNVEHSKKDLSNSATSVTSNLAALSEKHNEGCNTVVSLNSNAANKRSEVLQQTVQITKKQHDTISGIAAKMEVDVSESRDKVLSSVENEATVLSSGIEKCIERNTKLANDVKAVTDAQSKRMEGQNNASSSFAGNLKWYVPTGSTPSKKNDDDSSNEFPTFKATLEIPKSSENCPSSQESEDPVAIEALDDDTTKNECGDENTENETPTNRKRALQEVDSNTTTTSSGMVQPTKVSKIPRKTRNNADTVADPVL